jgi:hypothetical protein
MSNRATVSRSHPAPSPATLARFATPRSRTGDEGIMRATAKAWIKSVKDNLQADRSLSACASASRPA